MNTQVGWKSLPHDAVKAESWTEFKRRFKIFMDNYIQSCRNYY